MMISAEALGHGFSWQVNRYSVDVDVKVYWGFSKIRRGSVISSWSLQATPCGGLEFRSYKKHKGTIGWRLRGPVEHFESSW